MKNRERKEWIFSVGMREVYIPQRSITPIRNQRIIVDMNGLGRI